MSSWPAAILWDMDGTLVDTERYWFDAEHELVEAHGGRWSDDQARALVGQQLLTSAAVLRAEAPVGLEPQQIVDLLLAGVVARLREHVPWRPGVEQLLAAQHAAGVPAALVTSSWRSLVDALLEAVPPGTFAAVVTGDEVTRGKPDAEPYLRAAAQLDLAPGECLAIEDSVPGSASARAAGVPVLAVPAMVALDEQPGQVVCPTLDGVGLDALRGMFGR